MPWVEVFALFAVAHLVGDYVLQTNWQASNKRGGLTDGPVARRALASHIATYTLAFVPVLIWLADDLGAGVLWVAALVALPHMVQDDGRLVDVWLRRVKRLDVTARPDVGMAVDQTFHLVALLLLAVMAGS